MAQWESLAPASSLRPVERWRAARLSLEFFIDAANLSRGNGDLLLPLVFAAIVQANQAMLRREGDVQRRYGDSGEAIPDDLRRPISINAVAQSLRLPFETVRRKVRQLVSEGLCVQTPTGVYVPQAVIVSDRHAAVQAARMERLIRFHGDLQRAGFFSPAEALPRAPSPELKRTINRALSEYMLRTSDRAIEIAGGVIDGFVLMGLCLVNTDELAGEGPVAAGGELWPSSMRAVAARLRMPHETVRRRLQALHAAGLAERRNVGWIVSAPPELASRIATLAAENEADLRRLFGRLRELADTDG